MDRTVLNKNHEDEENYQKKSNSYFAVYTCIFIFTASSLISPGEISGWSQRNFQNTTDPPIKFNLLNHQRLSQGCFQIPVSYVWYNIFLFFSVGVLQCTSVLDFAEEHTVSIGKQF